MKNIDSQYVSFYISTVLTKDLFSKVMEIGYLMFKNDEKKTIFLKTFLSHQKLKCTKLKFTVDFPRVVFTSR